MTFRFYLSAAALALLVACGADDSADTTSDMPDTTPVVSDDPSAPATDDATTGGAPDSVSPGLSPAERDRLSYAYGVSIGDLVRDNLEMASGDAVDFDRLARVLTDAATADPRPDPNDPDTIAARTSFLAKLGDTEAAFSDAEYRAYGIFVEDQLRRQFAEAPGDLLAYDAAVRGVAAGIDGSATLDLTDPKLSLELGAYESALNTAANAARRDAALVEVQTYLDGIRAMEDVQETDSGLLYRVIESGDGARPELRDTVRVHYEGRFPEGEVFDSSFDRGMPTEFGVTDVIDGWTEGLQLMPAGSTYEFWIHPDLAYGESGLGPIPGHTPLNFTVKLIEIIE